MVQEVAVEQVLAGLLQADHRVQLGRRLVREHRVQEPDVRGRHLHVDEEVGAVGGEQQRQFLLFGQQRVHVQPAVGGVLDRHGERRGPHAVDDAPDHVGGLVPVEQRRQHLQLVVRLGHVRARRAGAERGQQAGEVAPEVGEARRQAEVEDGVDQRAAQSPLARVIASVRRRVGLDVLGGDRRAHEDEPVVEVRAVQDLARHRVEERLGALGLLVVDEQADEVQLDALPQSVGAAAVEPGRPELAPDALHGLDDPAVVVVDPVARDVAQRAPVARLEVALRGARAVAEQRVVAVEAVAQRARDRVRGVVGGRGEARRGGGGERARGHRERASGEGRESRCSTPDRTAGPRRACLPGPGSGYVHQHGPCCTLRT